MLVSFLKAGLALVPPLFRIAQEASEQLSPEVFRGPGVLSSFSFRSGFLRKSPLRFASFRAQVFPPPLDFVIGLSSAPLRFVSKVSHGFCYLSYHITESYPHNFLSVRIWPSTSNMENQSKHYLGHLKDSKSTGYQESSLQPCLVLGRFACLPASSLELRHSYPCPCPTQFI